VNCCSSRNSKLFLKVLFLPCAHEVLGQDIDCCGGFVDQRYWYWHDTRGTYWESRHHCTKWDCKVHASSKGEFGGDISKHQYWILLILGWCSLGEWDHEISFRRGNYVLHVQLVL
jgi:hypothetical protein